MVAVGYLGGEGVEAQAETRVKIWGKFSGEEGFVSAML